MTDIYDTASPYASSFTPAVPGQPERFVFTGRGSEYFRIWIVNLILTIVTLGIYSAWAKVRTTRYFYDNTSVAGASFDYHGNPIAILKGRITAFVMLILYNLAFRFSPALGFSIFFLMVLVLPWMIWQSLRFKLYNSSYRGIRFGLLGNVTTAYLVFLLYPVLTFCTVYLLTPFTHQRIKRFQHGASRFGHTPFSFSATVGSFYRTYGVWLGLILAGGAVIALGFSNTLSGIFSAHSEHRFDPSVFSKIGIAFAVLEIWLLMILPLFMSMMQNLIWNNTQLGEHAFESDLKWLPMSWIVVSNVILVGCTFGLFMPFARVRLRRYQIEALSLIPATDLSEFTAGVEPTGSATGEGLVDFLNVDFSL